MKKTLLMMAMAAVAVALQAATVKVDRIEPTDWWVGLHSAVPSVQLMVYGPGIRDAEVSTTYPGAVIDSLVRLDSPNYLLIYMNLSGAQAGTMPLNFKLGKAKKTVNYTLRQREMAGSQRRGFTNADVLYMLMPDRFADGNPANNVVRGMRSTTCDRSRPSVRHGGDLEGIRQHLDYLNELGVTALWFTPVLENDSPEGPYNDTYHGYATTNYYRV
ncbi:MAG: cyclomaltodextrinase N-terminal domain-containing protein, partial [Muribaculaceae bacterium]|nr:cyclomaltodextrinase N-terminal domain-containing protein [Muribaculaceae bacterium]